jgi:hypothetical protein
VKYLENNRRQSQQIGVEFELCVKRLWLAARGGISCQGCLQPGLPNVPITEEVTDCNGHSVLVHALTDAAVLRLTIQ